MVSMRLTAASRSAQFLEQSAMTVYSPTYGASGPASLASAALRGSATGRSGEKPSVAGS